VRGAFLREFYRQYDAKQYDMKRFNAICSHHKINRFKEAELIGMMTPLLKELSEAEDKTNALESATARICMCLGLFERYPIAIDKSIMDRPVPDKVLKKLRGWFVRLRDSLPEYADLQGDAKMAARAVNFLLNYMGSAGLPDSPKYRIIVKALTAK
jgi:hypothetical protein